MSFHYRGNKVVPIQHIALPVFCPICKAYLGEAKANEAEIVLEDRHIEIHHPGYCYCGILREKHPRCDGCGILIGTEHIETVTVKRGGYNLCPDCAESYSKLGKKTFSERADKYKYGRRDLDVGEV